jgi:hypothetical protein
MMGPQFRKSSHSNYTSSCLEAAFRKSSYSGNEGGECLEAAFRKSSYSTGANNCVEVANRGTVLVRDSKDVTIPGLAFTPVAWEQFLKTIKA